MRRKQSTIRHRSRICDGCSVTRWPMLDCNWGNWRPAPICFIELQGKSWQSSALNANCHRKCVCVCVTHVDVVLRRHFERHIEKKKEKRFCVRRKIQLALPYLHYGVFDWPQLRAQKCVFPHFAVAQRDHWPATVLRTPNSTTSSMITDKSTYQVCAKSMRVRSEAGRITFKNQQIVV